MPQAQFPCGLAVEIKLGKHEQLGPVQRGNLTDNCHQCEHGIHLQKHWTVCNGRVEDGQN